MTNTSSLSRLEKEFSRRNIQSIGFDLDNTLLDTDPYYVRVKDSVFNDFVNTYFDRKDREINKEKLNKIASLRYKYRHTHGLKPPLIYEECYDTISDTFPETLDERLGEILELHTKDFYTTSPSILPGAGEVLDSLTEIDFIKHIFGATDAQEDWSRIKAEYVLENTRLKEFPYFSTDLKVRKNPEWWLSVFEKLKTKPENILIVGDNYYADVYSSLLAGVKHAIWINKYKKSLDEFKEYPLPEGAEVAIVNSIDEITK